MRIMKVLSSTVAMLAIGSALRTQTATAPTSGWRARFLTSLGGLERKYVALAEAMPQDRYAWRPTQGVRSVCEVFLHMAGANYLFSAPLGAKTPTNVDVQKIEQCPANKAQVVSTLKVSFAHVRDAVVATPEADSDAKITLFGVNMTKRGLFLLAAEHAGEHLGQSIAYARSNGVVPPWSARGGGN